MTHDRQRLVDTYREMIREVSRQNGGHGGGMAVSRLRDPATGAVSGCLVYVEGVTAERTARAVERVQEEALKHFRPSIFGRIRAWFAQGRNANGKRKVGTPVLSLTRGATERDSGAKEAGAPAGVTIETEGIELDKRRR